MSISDGYGDVTEGELAKNYTRWARKIANEWVGPQNPLHDDLVQEALWAIIRRARARPDLSATYLALVGKGRMHDVLAGRPMSGSPAERGQTYRPKTISASLLEDTEPDYWEQLTAVDQLEGVEIAYHDGEIAQALSALEPKHREYVLRRFWGGQTDTEIAKDMGVGRTAPGNWWARSIRPALRTQLAMLSGVA